MIFLQTLTINQSVTMVLFNRIDRFGNEMKKKKIPKRSSLRKPWNVIFYSLFFSDINVKI